MSEGALGTYLDFLDASDSSTQTNKENSRIDAVLKLYRERSRCKESSEPVVPPLTESLNEPSYESRLHQLEEKLTHLLSKSKGDYGNQGVPDTPTLTKALPSETDGSSPPSSLRRERHLPLSRRSSCRTSQRKKTVKSEAVSAVTSAREDHRKRKELLKSVRSSSGIEPSPSIKVLTGELDCERERRWKSEQAAARLVEHVRSLQTQASEAEKRRELAIIHISQLERKAGEDDRTIQSLQKHVQQLQEEVSSHQQDVVKWQHQMEEQRKLLSDLEENYRQLEADKLRTVTVLQSRLQAGEVLTAGHQRDADVLKKSLKQSKMQVQQLQELLANKEREHQQEREWARPLDGKEVRELIASQVQAERERMTASQSQLQIRLSEQQKAYGSLEEEFRTALQIEASRYSELERSHQEMCREMDASRQTAVMAVQKEQRAAALVAELTGLVKEQKAKIKELSKSKQEMVSSMRERILRLEEEVASKNRLEARLLSTQEDKASLHSQVLAQESVISGLREERQLWGKELAHQGATLAQERGRIEAQLEVLTKEASTLSEQLGRERDAVRVKEKQVADQAHSIQQLKSTVAELRRELEAVQGGEKEELLKMKALLEQEEASNEDMQEQVRTLLDRKEELKEDLATALKDKEQWKAKFNDLNTQWTQKVKIIDSLEENLQQLQKTFQEKENQLVQERDEALHSARNCEQRLKACDDAFREQLEAKEKLYHSNLARLLAEKNGELEAAHQKVERVEEEMRELLQEVAKERKAMGAKVLKLSSVMQDLQKDITNE